MAKPHRKGPKPSRPASGGAEPPSSAKNRSRFRILITRTQYRVLDVEADNAKEAEDFAMELASDGGTQGWDDFECSAELNPERDDLPEPFRLDPDREQRVEKIKVPSGFQTQLVPLDDDEDDDEDDD